MNSRARLRRLARLSLTCFVLTLAAAVLAPVLQPVHLQQLCTAQGSRWLDADGQLSDGQSQMQHTLECVMCFAANTPPASTWPMTAVHAQVAQVSPAPVENRQHQHLHAPQQARAPPGMS